MSPHKRDNRAALIFIVALLLIAPLAVILFNDDVALRGATIIPEVTQEPDDSAAADTAPVEEEETDDENADTPVGIPTSVPPTVIPPTAVPATSVPPTAEAPEVTEEPAPVIPPEATDEPDAETTPEVAPETTPEADPEVTPEVDPEATPEVEATEEADSGLVTLEAFCAAGGGQFVLSNTGLTDENGTYHITDANGGEVASGDFALAAGDVMTFDVAFGVYHFNSEAASATLDCVQAVEIVVSYACTLADGVIFTLGNAGGPQTEAMPYMLDGVEGSFIIEGENAFTLEAGYGLPVLMLGEAVYSPEESCDEPGEIRGGVWDDADGNALFGSSETGLAAVRVVLVNADGVELDVLTEADGSYIFVHLAAGQYTVYVDWESVPLDYVWTYDLDGGEDASVSVTIGIGETVISDFGFREQVPVSLTGVVWDDANGDAFLNDGESGLAQVAVILLRGGEVVQTTLTGENGVYEFTDVLAGDYGVSIDMNSLRAGFAPTYDLDGGLDGRTAVLAENGVDIQGLDFGFRQLADGVIDGLVWSDTNLDGLYSDGETGLANVTVILTASETGEQFTTATDEAGQFRFSALAAGAYSLSVDGASVPAGYNAQGDAATAVELAEANSAESVLLAYAPEATGSISGFIWLELANYGVYDSNESGFKGLTVDLLNASGVTVGSVTLGADGVYHFDDLPVGDYTVQIETGNIPSKLIVTLNPAGDGAFAASVTLNPGEAVQGVDFGILGTF